MMVAAAAAVAPAGAVEVFVSLDPCRVFDTRTTDPPSLDNTNFVANPTPPPPAIAQDVRAVTIAGNPACSVPVGATAVAGNVIVVTPTAAGFLTVFPEDANFQGASLLNFPAYKPVQNTVDPEFATDNGAILVLDDDGELGLAWDSTPTTSPGTHTAHIVIDVTGYFVELAAGTGLELSGNGLAIDAPFQLPQTGCDDGEVVTSDGLGGWTCETAVGGGGGPGAGLIFDKGDVYEVSVPSGPIADGLSINDVSASCNDETDVAIEWVCEPNPNSDVIVTDDEIANWAGTAAAASVTCDFQNVPGGDLNNGNGHARIYCLPAGGDDI
jgi:hypothetical protein